MSTFLEKFSLFPYMDLWRVSGKTQVNNKFAGFISILLILAIAAIAFAKLIEVSKMTTIFATQQSQIQTIAPMINLTTSFSDATMDQFMFAVKSAYFDNANTFYTDQYSFGFSYSIQSYNKTTKQFTYKNTFQNMQRCTPDHFHRLPDINNNFNSWSMDSWWCLPINRTFQIGGTEVGDQKSLRVSIDCQGTACQLQNKSIVLHAYTLNTFVNPTNGTQPLTSYLTKYQMTFQSYTNARTFLYINKNTLITDNSLLPYNKETTLTSLQTNQNVISNSFPNNNGAFGTYFIAYSGTNVIHKRYYLKFLDAFAYLGGIFNAILGAFFFMNVFGRFFYQMDFGNQLFKKSKLSEVTALTHFKQIVYDFLASFNKQPNWKYSKYINELRSTINNLLDIVYLQRRLQFLQKGIEILLEKHQLKGLYLIHEVTKEDSDKNFQNYKLNDKFSQYFKAKTQTQKEPKKKARENLEAEKQQKDASKVKMEALTNTEGEINKNNAIHMQNSKRRKQKEVRNINSTIVLNQQLQNQANLDNYQDLSLSEDDIMALLKLCREAKQKKGDNRSRRIYENIDIQLRQKLQEMLKYQIPSISNALNL